MIAEGENILQLIPQKPPMVMIDKLYSCDENTCVSGLSILRNNIFCDDNYFYESGLIENIAQTAAASVGVIAQRENKEAPVGFIGSVKRLKIYKRVAVGTDIVTTVDTQQKVGNVSIIKGRVEQDNDIIAECEMNIFLQE